MNRNLRKCIVILITFCQIWLASPSFAQNRKILTLAEEYSIALKKYQKKGKRVSIEGVFRKGKALSDENWEELEALSENEYLELKAKMKGFLVNREEILYIEPDPKFFEKQSRRYGLSSDVAFFRLMQKVKPDGVWAAYVEQQTDVTGCTRYGSRILTSLYGDLRRFKRSYPNKYVTDINDEVDEILAAFSGGGCACGEFETVLREFRLFIRSYPRDRNTSEIRNNLIQIKKQSDLRPNCHSG